VLIYPLKGKVLLGTTDLAHDMNEPVRCTEEEVDYFFELVNHVFPSIAVDRSQIIFRFSGVRPLPRSDAGSTGQISRDYRIEKGSLGGTPVLSLVGGKWTTFRALGEQLGGVVLEILGRSRTASTDGRLIGGAVGYPTTDSDRAAWLAKHGTVVGRERADTLLDRYGSDAQAIIARIEAGEDAPLNSNAAYTRLELTHLVETEQVVRLVDVVLRRTSLAFTGQVDAALLDELAELVGGLLGWSPEQRATERAAAADYLADHHAVRVDDAQGAR